MEILHSYLRRHFTGKPVVASWNVGCFLGQGHFKHGQTLLYCAGPILSKRGPRHCMPELREIKTKTSIACTTDVIKPRLVRSAKKHQDPCSGPSTALNVSNFLSTCLANQQWLFNRPSMVRIKGGAQAESQDKDFGAVLQTNLTRVISFVFGAG